MRRGFTLIEVLVAIGIIVILAGLAVPAVSAARRRSQVRSLEALFDRLDLAIATYRNDWGDCPPDRLRRVLPGAKVPQAENEGVEALLACLFSEQKQGPYASIERTERGDLDGDGLEEVLDPWGNPIGYIHNRGYDSGANVGLQTDSGGTQSVAVLAAKAEDTTQFRGLTTYQLWSAGPDGEADTEDDLRAWGE